MPPASPVSVTTAPRGVYILGNDRVAGFLEALLHSLRTHSPQLPARLIPYNDALAKTRELCARYDVALHDDPTFPELEKLGLGLWASSPYSNHQKLFRRLSIFWGPFERFLYLDADICVLSPLEPLFDAYERSNADFASFDVDHERVYMAGPLRDRMIREYGSLGFNSGHFFSRRGVFDLATFQAEMRAAQPYAEEFQDRGDQGFLNFAVDHARKKQARIKDYVEDLADKQWAEQPLHFKRGAWRLNQPSHPDHGKRLVLIHWSGYGSPGWRLPNRWIYYRYRRAADPSLKGRLLPLRDWIAHCRAPMTAWFHRTKIAFGQWRRNLHR